MRLIQISRCTGEKWNFMQRSDQTKKNALSAILLYELSRLELLTTATKVRIASELTVAIQTLRMSQAHADHAFNQNQAAHYSVIKRAELENKNQSESQIRFSVASIMHCVHLAYEVDDFQNELIASALNWVRDNVMKAQTWIDAEFRFFSVKGVWSLGTRHLICNDFRCWQVLDNMSLARAVSGAICMWNLKRLCISAITWCGAWRVMVTLSAVVWLLPVRSTLSWQRMCQAGWHAKWNSAATIDWWCESSSGRKMIRH